MKKIIYSFIIFFSFCNVGFSQISGCNVLPKIRGPLLIKCNASSPTRSHYYPQDGAGMSGINWILGPNNSVGTLTLNSFNNEVDVDWAPHAVSQHAYLVMTYNGGGGADTLWPQQECCTPPHGLTSTIQDLDDNFLSAIDVANAFGTNGNANGNEISVNGGTYFIEGQFNLNNYKIIFTGCTLFMGSGAVIYLGDGFFSPATLITNDVHIYGTNCGMWKGIVAPGDGRISINGSTIDDAETAIKAGNCLLAIECKNVLFNNNFISIYYPENLINTNSFTEMHGLPTIFEQCTFQSISPMTLPPFNGQHWIPLDRRPFAGMLLNNIAADPSQPGSPSIPFSTASTSPCVFDNLNYGIYAINSQVDVVNCRFNNIYSTMYPLDFGCAIVSDNTCPNCLNVTQLSIGNHNANNSNAFNDCQVGVYAFGESDLYISNNKFTTSQNLSNNLADIYIRKTFGGRNININSNSLNDFGIGVQLTDIGNAYLQVNDNYFSTAQAVNSTGSFSSTAIYLTTFTGTPMHGDISMNTFQNNRIGMYLNGFRGNTASDFDIHDNYFINDIPYSDLQTLYNSGRYCYGIWCDNTRYINIRSNTFSRQPSNAPVPTDFDKMLRALNIKQSRFLEIYENDILNFGTPMRFVSNCNSTNLHCNYMYSCYKGIYLDYVSMTAQGGPGDPWENKWWFTGNADRVLGSSVLSTGIYWYHQGTTCTGYCTNEYSPGPFAFGTITAVPNQTGSVTCIHGPGGGGNQNYMNIADNSTSYNYFPDESRYYDKEYLYQLLKENSILRNSDPVFQNYFSTEEQSNIGKFDEANDDALNGDQALALSKLNVIIDQNNIEYNKKFVTSLRLQKIINNEETFNIQEQNELERIAWQTAWEGGNAVFEARGMLKLEIDDQSRNLRIGRNIFSQENNSLSVFPNPTNGNVNFSSEKSVNGIIQITDATGRIVSGAKLINGHTTINNLDAGIYFAGIVVNGTIQSFEKFIVIK